MRGVGSVRCLLLLAGLGTAVVTPLIATGCRFGNDQVRTVDAAKSRFDNDSFLDGQTTKAQVKEKLGSPNDIKKLGGNEEQWTYVKTEEVGIGTVTTDTSTNYIAEYTFDARGLLRDKNYRAVPGGGNGLTR